MRIGLSSSLEHDNPGQWARRMKELGCGAVVFPVDYTASEELVNAYVQAAGEEGLSLPRLVPGVIPLLQMSRSGRLQWSAVSAS